MLRDHFQVVWRAVRRFGVPEASADDAAQEVFIVAAKKLDAIESGRERPFLYGVAARVAANFRRSTIYLHEGPSTDGLDDTAGHEPGADALLEQKQRRELLDRILDGMPQDLRTVFVLFELEGLSGPEIADVLEVPRGTVASRLRRARAQFAAAVETARERFP